MQVIRRFTVIPSQALCAMFPELFTEGREYEVLAIDQSRDNLCFLIVDNIRGFVWLDQAECTVGKIYDL